MEVTNSHLPSGSLRSWLLATGGGRQKSTAKSGLASKCYGIWMCYLNADVGSTACNISPSERSWLFDLDELGSCSHLTARPRCTRVCYSILYNACGASDKGAVWSVVVGEPTGGCASPVFCPLMPEFSSSRRYMMRSCWSLKATIASRTPYILYIMACSAAMGRELAQNSSMRLFSVVWAGFNSADDTSLPASCH